MEEQKTEEPSCPGVATRENDPQSVSNAKNDYPNIIIGKTGCGKSSIINMLNGDREAKVSNAAKGETFQNDLYVKELRGRKLNVFDTVGLDEGDKGTCVAEKAIKNLWKLICRLENGVSLLVYVVQGPRIDEKVKQNYDLFYNQICFGMVPIVLIVTHLEDEDDMDQWWFDNEQAFKDYEMKFTDSACIVASKGKLKKGVHVFQEEYDQSKTKVQDLIAKRSESTPWKMTKLLWLQQIVKTCGAHFGRILLSGTRIIHEILEECAEGTGEAVRVIAGTLQTLSAKYPLATKS
ncbi:hypothetical protein CPB86DRAFT_742883 [Serendipita vermifera]|nr:hypothetical protein CPB86DRAFT_742883 [Serendipita vermifera]